MHRSHSLIACAAALIIAATSARAAPPAFLPLEDPDLQVIVTPSADHAPFVAAIDGAKKSVDLEMFHLTDEQVISALVRAAKRGVKVRVILDGGTLKPKKLARVLATLGDGGVDARASSPAFSITHEKAMIVDAQVAFITAINLTKPVATTRDFGVVTRAPSVVAEVEKVFAADVANASAKTATTPELGEPSLVWSPGAREKLVALIGSATTTIDATVENISDPQIVAALAAAARRGVTVRMIVPECDQNADPLHNLPTARSLSGAGVSIRLMPPPASADTPYMHSKMILADAATTATAYVGSVNFSTNSTTKARELGIIFKNAHAADTIAKTFAIDWSHTVAVPENDPKCSRNAGN